MVNIKLWNEKRKEQNITLDELSKMTEISISTLKDIFRGKTTSPRIDTVQAIERALGLTSPTLEWTDEEKALGVGNHKTALSAKEWRVLEAFSELERVKGEAFAENMLQIIESIPHSEKK